MATRQELEAAVREADARLDRLQPLMEQYERDALLDDGGKWSVRDCLSHVAASARISMAARRALDSVSGAPRPAASAPSTPAPSVDERTAQQVAERSDKSIADLIAEAKQAHVAALEDLAAMSDEDLATPIPPPAPDRPGTSVGGAALRMLEFHEGGQMDRIENALRLRTRWT